MKKLSYILIGLLVMLSYSCREDDKPYVGYINVQRTVMEATTGSVTITADTDLSEPIIMELSEADAEWCKVSSNGKQITVTAEANPSTTDFRTATVKVKCGYRISQFTVLQKYEGQQYLEYDWTGWEATGSDVQASDGGGYASLFKNERTNYWHSQYSPALTNPLPHTITIDMRKELPVAMVRIARRHYAGNGNNYPTVKTMEIHTSSNGNDFTKVGGFTFALPWTAPNGTVISGNSPLIPPYEDVVLSEITKARYVKLVITETNNTTGACQVAYFKAYEKL